METLCIYATASFIIAWCSIFQTEATCCMDTAAAAAAVALTGE